MKFSISIAGNMLALPLAIICYFDDELAYVVDIHILFIVLSFEAAL